MQLTELICLADNFTKFWILSSGTASLPGSLSSATPRNALLRLSLNETAYSRLLDLNVLLTRLELHVSQIDRRPSTEAKPFHDVYFLEVAKHCRNHAEVVEEMSWQKELEEALERSREIGWDGCILGTW